MSYDMQMAIWPTHLIAGYVPPFPDQYGLFMISNRAMYDMEDVMTIAGVLDTETVPEPLPDWPPKGISQKRIDKLGAVFCIDGAEVNVGHDCIYPLTSREERLFEAWAEQTNAILCRRSDLPGKVPAHKFQSHAGWFVCPEECQVIATGLLAGLKHDKATLISPYVQSGMSTRAATAWIRRWALFNQMAATHGGYRVS